MVYDVIVVGAGPAGTIAAYELARARKKVLLIEKEKLPRYKTCGGGIPKSVLSWLGIDISKAVEQEISKARYTYNCKNPHNSESPFPIVVMVMRDKFDYILAEAAIKVGTELLDNTTVAGIDIKSESIIVRSEKNEWKAKYVIGADGALSVVSKFARLNAKKNLGIGLEVEIPSTERTLLEKSEFGFGLVKDGYAWSFPKKDLLSIGIGTFKLGERTLKDRLVKWLEYLGFGYFTEKLHAHPLPYFSKEKAMAKDNVILVGDAASLMNPLSGKGISYALKSGKFAAEAIIKNDVKIYEKKLKEEIYPDLKISRRLADLFYTFPKFCYDKAVCDPKVNDLFARLMAGDSTYKEIWDTIKRKLLRLNY